MLLGHISLYRQEVRPFYRQEIALLQNFAAQAVIAMENARLITEQREALEQQTATAEVLQVINASPGNLVPVFDAILEKAHNLCDVAVGSLSIYLNGAVHTAATRGFSEEYQALLRRPYPAIGAHQALMRGGPSRQTPDFRTVPVSPEMASSLDHLERMNLRTGLWVPLRKDGTALGCISAYRDKVQPFTEKEIALLENFAAQAVIAMENARLTDRAAGGAGTADRDRGRVAGDQCLARRTRPGVRRYRRKSHQAVRRRGRRVDASRWGSVQSSRTRRRARGLC